VGEDPVPLVYLPRLQNYSPEATLQVRTSGNPNAVLGTVRAQVQSIDRNLALTNIQTIGQILSDGLWAARMGAALLTLFALLALILASIGIYGVMAYSVSQRTQEVGIRMALGAQPSHVFKLVIGQGMILAAIGMAAGLAGALLLTRVLASLLFGVSPHDPITFGGVTVLLGLVALLACYVPARRATRIDPLVALRYE
jgi:putative ABC transport system permease protein